MTVHKPLASRRETTYGLLVLALAIVAFLARCVASVHFSGLPPTDVHVFSAILVDLCILPFWVGSLVMAIIGIRRLWDGPWCGIAAALAVVSPVTGALISTLSTLGG